MEYLLVEIVLYLVGAGLIGFVLGWVLRAELIIESAGKRDENVDQIVPKTEETQKEESQKAAIEKVDTEKVMEKAVEVSTPEISKDKVTEETVSQKEEVKAVTPEIEKTIESVKDELEVSKDDKRETSAVDEVKNEVLEEEVSKERMDKPTLFISKPATGKDKLSALKGLGPALEKKLNALGIYTFEQIASWTPEQEVWVGTQIAFPNKVTKEAWVKQAQDLLKSK